MKLKWGFAWIEGCEIDLGILAKKNYFLCYTGTTCRNVTELKKKKSSTGVLEFSKYTENVISVSV